MRHAYLVMIHKNIRQVKLLLSLLDGEKNDIYIHCDKKSSISKEELESAVKHSGIYFTERLDVRWGGYSQIECELLLLKAAVKKKYDYYHLLSGQDLPIKPPGEIERFFEKNQGRNFVEFLGREETDRQIENRISRYTLLEGNVGVIPFINQGLRTMQKLLGVNRICPEVAYGYGGNWFSITGELAEYVLEMEPWIQKNFRYSICADELFLQTLIRNSRFWDTVFEPGENITGNLRYVDFARGNENNPYIFREKDYEELMRTDCLFARKFDSEVDEKIIEKISEKTAGENR